MIFRRRERPPGDLVAQLDRDERIVSWADTDDAVVAASNRGLWIPAYRRIGWELVDKAVWRDGVLTVTEAELVDDLRHRAKDVVHTKRHPGQPAASDGYRG